MSDLTDFLLARIAGDEAVARHVLSDYAQHKIKWESPSSGVVDVGDDDLDGFLTIGDGPLAHHIARHDPARVLAECEAKRRIVEAHPLTHDVVPVWTGTTPGVACQNCAALGRSEGDVVEDIGPCETLLALAAVYADHPDHRDEWKP